MGNIFIHLKDSFLVEDIQFDNAKHTVLEAISIDLMIDEIEKNTRSLCQSYVFNLSPKDPVIKKIEECPYSNPIKKIVMKTDEPDAASSIVDFIERFKNSNKDIPLHLETRILEHTKRIPHSKLSLYFFSGTKRANSVLFLSYPTVDHKNAAGEMSLVLVQAIRRLRAQIFSVDSKEEALKRKVQAYQIEPEKIKLSKNENGINIF